MMPRLDEAWFEAQHEIRLKSGVVISTLYLIHNIMLLSSLQNTREILTSDFH